MRLIMVRHGETYANVEKILQGLGNEGSLTKKGKDQAQKVGHRLKIEKIDKIVVSDLARTKDTAKPIIEHHPEAEVVYDSRLRERNMGIYEGKPYDSWKVDAESEGINYLEFKPKEGESIKMFASRTNSFLDEIIEKNKDKTVLLVTHGGSITQIFMYLLKINLSERAEVFAKYHPQNTAVSILQIKDDGNHEVKVLNSVEHLEA